MLMYHPQALSDGIMGGSKSHRLAAQQNLSRIRLVQAIQDIHQGGLTGPVFAQECMNFALAQVEIDASIGENTGESLGDLAHINDWGRKLIQIEAPVVLLRLVV
jgi:hypothetical protein